MLINSTAFSQTGTSKICFTENVAKQIAVDLTKCDSVKVELEATKEILEAVEEISNQKSGIITTQKQKEANLLEQIDLYKAKETRYQEIVLNLERDKSKDKRNFKIVIGTALLIISSLVIF